MTQPLQGTETGPQPRARILINRVDPVSGERKDQLPGEASAEVSQVEEKYYAFILRKVVYASEEDNQGEIEITSRPLWNLLRELLNHYPYHYFRGRPTTIRSPYEPFVLNWDKLEQAAKQSPKDDEDKQCQSDLELLLHTIANGSGDTKLDKYFRTRASNIEQRSVTFESLWTIFPPGPLVYGKSFQGEDEVFIVNDNATAWPKKREGQIWVLLCWAYDWTGKAFKRLCLRVSFESFDGQKPITALLYYPFKLVKDRDAPERKLIKRGERFRELCLLKQGSQMFDYSGEAIFDKKGFSGVQGDDEKASWVKYLHWSNTDPMHQDDSEKSRASFDRWLDVWAGSRTRQSLSKSSAAMLKSSKVRLVLLNTETEMD